jgi:hypothetical protein
MLDAKLSAKPIERDGRPGYRLPGELCIGRLLPTDTLRAVDSTITSAAYHASGGYFTTEAAGVTPSTDRFNRTGNGGALRAESIDGKRSS